MCLNQVTLINQVISRRDKVNPLPVKAFSQNRDPSHFRRNSDMPSFTRPTGSTLRDDYGGSVDTSPIHPSRLWAKKGRLILVPTNLKARKMIQPIDIQSGYFHHRDDSQDVQDSASSLDIIRIDSI